MHSPPAERERSIGVVRLVRLVAGLLLARLARVVVDAFGEPRARARLRPQP